MAGQMLFTFGYIESLFAFFVIVPGCHVCAHMGEIINFR